MPSKTVSSGLPNSNQVGEKTDKPQMMAGTRDWSLLPDDILESISHSLLSIDVTEYMRFRAVCRGWRQSTSPPSNTDRRFRPHNWISITSGYHDNFSHREVKDQCYFLNVKNGNYLSVNIPQLRQGYTPISVVDGLLVLLKTRTGELCLINPFSLSLTELPNVDSLFSIVPSTKKLIRHDLGSVNFLSSAVVVFYFKSHSTVAFATIKGDRWIGLNEKIAFSSTAFFRGHLFAVVGLTGEVMQFELLGLEPKLSMKMVIPASKDPLYHYYHGLVEFEGRMLLLRRYYDTVVPPEDRRDFEVYIVDLENGRLVLTTIPPDHTFFASDRRCLSVSTSVFPSLLPQSIYYYQRLDPSIKLYRSHRRNLQLTPVYDPSKLTIYCRSFCEQISRIPLPYHLICHCANFYMPTDCFTDITELY